jgi:DNA-binding LytR/AlgR family response regulator
VNILIIEDEPQAAKRLQTLVSELLPASTILDTIDSIKKSVMWFKSNASPDLVLMDIQLADGLSFQIFEQCEVPCPVIFTTAYDEYALQAFKVNSIDYILKPVDKDELNAALNKLTKLSSSAGSNRAIMENIGQVVSMLSKKYKERFVIKVGEHLRTIDVKKILYFYSQDKATFCCTGEKRNYILDYTIEQLEELVDPADFFRVNRKYLVRADSLLDIISYTNSRLKLVLKESTDTDVIVARERVQEFKEWLDR